MPCACGDATRTANAARRINKLRHKSPTCAKVRHGSLTVRPERAGPAPPKVCRSASQSPQSGAPFASFSKPARTASLSPGWSRRRESVAVRTGHDVAGLASSAPQAHTALASLAVLTLRRPSSPAWAMDASQASRSAAPGWTRMRANDHCRHAVSTKSEKWHAQTNAPTRERLYPARQRARVALATRLQRSEATGLGADPAERAPPGRTPSPTHRTTAAADAPRGQGR